MARVLGVAQEVLSPGEWVSAPAAKILLGLTAGTQFYDASRRASFTKEKTSKFCVVYLYSDLEKYAIANGIVLGDHMRPWLEMIVWVDTLQSMPSADEIAANVRKPYTVSDIHRLIETRIYRGLHGLNGEGKPINGNCRRGEEHNMAILSSDDVRAIRNLLREGITQLEVSKIFGVAERTICDIDTGKTWGSLPDETKGDM